MEWAGMIAVLCVVLSAVGFYFSVGLADHWWLAWLAPIPVLWLVFDLNQRWWVVFVGAWLAFCLGETNTLLAYGGVIPLPVLVLANAGPALLFATAALGARYVYGAMDRTHAMA